MRDLVLKELKKIAIILKNADTNLLKPFHTKTRNVLDRLPIEWKSVETDGFGEEESGVNAFNHAELKGDLAGKPVELNIKKDNENTNIYTLLFEGEKYKFRNMRDLESGVESIDSGGLPKNQIAKQILKFFKNNKTELHARIQGHYLAALSNKQWKMDIINQTSYIRLRFSIPVSPEEKKKINNKLKSHNYYVLNRIGTYIKDLIKKKLKVNPDKFKFEYDLIDLADEAGFILTIHY